VLWALDVTAGGENVLACTQVDVYFQLTEGQTLIPVEVLGFVSTVVPDALGSCA
jgi:hypothetical protein